MSQSETVGSLAKSLSIVQGKLQPAAKDSVNPFFKNSYADLSSVWDSCRSLLSENGLAVTQTAGSNEQGNHTLTTTLLHESGEWISDTTILPLTKIDSQSVGSAMTYFRRYGLASIVGIVADVDDDGNAASQPKQVKQQAPPQPTLRERIAKAQDAIKSLGGTVEPFDTAGANDAERQAELDALTEQYKKLKASKG